MAGGLQHSMRGAPTTRRSAALLAAGLVASIVSIGLVLGAPILRTQRLIGDLRDRGGTLETFPSAPQAVSWTGVTLGMEAITAADLARVDVTDGDLAELARGRDLQTLTIHGRGVTAAGLRHLLRMKSLSTLIVIDCPALTPAIEAELRSARPGLDLGRRGPAFLGVGGSGTTLTVDAETVRGVAVGIIAPDSPAHRAGITHSDVITAFDGTPTATFDELTEAIGRRQPGDEIAIELIRDDGSLRAVRRTVRPRLAGWRSPMP